jgi:peptidoglycan-associated lipoprotein
MRSNRALTRALTGLSTVALLTLLVAGCASPAQVVKPEVDARDAVAAPATPPPTAAPAANLAREGTAPACSISRVHFAFDSALLDVAARTELQGVASCLEQRRPAAVVIEGHTDERGTSGYNVALGNRRADAVRAYLKDLGVGAALQIVSFGKELPLVGGAGEPAWSQNRRAELRLPGDQRSDGQRVSN